MVNSIRSLIYDILSILKADSMLKSIGGKYGATRAWLAVMKLAAAWTLAPRLAAAPAGGGGSFAPQQPCRQPGARRYSNILAREAERVRASRCCAGPRLPVGAQQRVTWWWRGSMCATFLQLRRMPLSPNRQDRCAMARAAHSARQMHALPTPP